MMRASDRNDTREACNPRGSVSRVSWRRVCAVRGAKQVYQTKALTNAVGAFGARAGDETMAATAHDDDRLARLEEGQDALVRGVAQMNETLATHTAMLERILLAAAEEAPGGVDLAEALRDMATALAAQEAALARLDARLGALPGQIAEAVGAAS